MAKNTGFSRSFSTQIRDFNTEFGHHAAEMHTLVAIDLRNEIHDAAPYETGDLKASITMSVGKPPTVFDGHVITHEEVMASENKTIYIGTDKPYSHVIEYGLYPKPPKKPTGRTWNGFSTQAQTGFFRISIKNIENKWG